MSGVQFNGRSLILLSLNVSFKLTLVRSPGAAGDEAGKFAASLD